MNIWEGTPQLLGMGVLRVIANLIGLIDFNQLAMTHNGNAVTQLAHQGQIVGDKEDREAELFSEMVYLLLYSSLNDDIQSRSWLIHDDQFGIERESNRNH